jgi:hypothetical protein
LAVIGHLANNCTTWWPVAVSIVNPVGVYNKPYNYAQEAMKTTLLGMQSEVQYYAREKMLQETMSDHS